MRNTIALICILAIPAPAASAADVAIQGDLYPLNTVPTFDHGYLAVYDRDGIAVYGPDGAQTMKIGRPDEGAINNADIDVDGSVVVAASPAERDGLISIFNPDGSVAGTIKTGVYTPSQICFAPDHSIWVVGSEDTRSGYGPPDYSLLRHYSRSGQLLGEYFPRSSFREDISPHQGNLGMWRLRIAGDRVGAILNAKDGRLWLEADLNGKELGHWAMPRGLMPAAMTEDGTVYAEGRGLAVLDRKTGSWKPVGQYSSDILLGAEGNTLVFAIRGSNYVRRTPEP